MVTNGCKKGWVYEGYNEHLYVRVMVSINVRVTFMVMCVTKARTIDWWMRVRRPFITATITTKHCGVRVCD